MKLKLIAIVCLLLLLLSCKETDVEDCSVVSCASQAFTIEFIDSEGNNLIENNTYLFEDILISKDGNTLFTDLSEPDNIISFPISGVEGANTYQIKLNDSETDQLVLQLSKVSPDSECCGPYFDINTALYNDVEVEVLSDANGYSDGLKIIKP